MSPTRLTIFACLLAAVCLVATCKEETQAGSAATSTVASSGAGGCNMVPEATFQLKVTAMDGPLPADTTIQVRWSMGDEPELVLSDPSTYKSLDESALVCDLDPETGPPMDLQELVCELWTGSTTEVEIPAMGYLTALETLQPELMEGCERPILSEVELQLIPDRDAGPMK